MTATDSLAINGFSQADPFLMQALKSPNYYQMLQAQQKDAHAAVADNTRVAKTPAISNPSFQGVARATEEPKSNKGTAILLTAIGLTIGGAVLIASRGKTKKGFIENFKAGWNSLFKKGASAEANSIQMRNINGQNIISLGNKAHSLNVRPGSYVNSTKLAQEARSTYGLNFNPNLKLDDAAAKLNSTKFTFKTSVKGKKGKTITTEYEGIYRKGELVGLKDITNNKAIDLNSVPQDAETIVKNIIEQLPNKKVPSGVTLKDTTYIQTFEGGQAMFLANTTGKNGLRVVRTNRYKINDDAVKNACKDPKLKQAIIDYEAGKFDSWNITEGIWKPAKSKSLWEKLGFKKSSEYKSTLNGKKWDDSIELVIKDGKVIGLTKDGGKTMFAKAGTDKFGAYEVEFPEIFENVLSHNKDFTGNIVRTLA